MDPELAALVTRLDSEINNLPLNPMIPVDRIRDLQNRRADIDKQMSNFKSELERKNNDFKNRIKSMIDDVQNRISRVHSEVRNT
jgi:hypothetical protein